MGRGARARPEGLRGGLEPAKGLRRPQRCPPGVLQQLPPIVLGSFVISVVPDLRADPEVHPWDSSSCEAVMCLDSFCLRTGMRAGEPGTETLGA